MMLGEGFLSKEKVISGNRQCAKIRFEQVLGMDEKTMRKSGFLLFEVLITVVILSFGIVFTMRAFHNVLMIDRRSTQFFYSDLAVEALALHARYRFGSSSDFPSAGKVSEASDLTYAAEKTHLTLNDGEGVNEAGEGLVPPDFNYYLVTVKVNIGETELLDYPLVMRKGAGTDEI
jgi:hypothetical protein